MQILSCFFFLYSTKEAGLYCFLGTSQQPCVTSQHILISFVVQKRTVLSIKDRQLNAVPTYTWFNSVLKSLILLKCISAAVTCKLAFFGSVSILHQKTLSWFSSCPYNSITQKCISFDFKLNDLNSGNAFWLMTSFKVSDRNEHIQIKAFILSVLERSVDLKTHWSLEVRGGLEIY